MKEMRGAMTRRSGIVFLSIITAAFLLGLAGPHARAQKGSSEKQTVEVRLTLVDVVVTQDGEFVKDLTREEFEVYEDGRRVPINSFELISFQDRETGFAQAGEKIDSAGQGGKKLVVVFDAINTWKKEVNKAGQAIIDDLLSLVGLGHEVMVCQIGPRTGADILLPFTSDQDHIREAVVRASGSLWQLGTDVEPIRLVEEIEIDVDEEASLEGSTEGGRMRMYFRDTQRETFMLEEKKRFEQSVGSLLAVFNMIRHIPGRKTVLLVSAGIPDLSPEDLFPNIRSGIPGYERQESPERAYRRLGYDKLENVNIFDPFNILGDKKFKQGEEVLRELIQFANAHNISVYSLDADIFVKHLFSGTSAEYYQKMDMEHFRLREADKIRKVQNLRWLAEETGADAVRGAAKIDQFRRVMETDMNNYYQLSFYPRRKQADDVTHKIEVKVKRRGVDVRFRKSYTDYSEKEVSKMLLVSAFYNPALFKNLPFEAEFALFHTPSGRFEPWMNIALPVQPLFLERFIEYAPNLFNLFVWIKQEASGARSFGGTINIGVNVSEEFMGFIRNVDYLTYHFRGPEVDLKPQKYVATFALFDPRTNEVGTWETEFFRPRMSVEEGAKLINAIMGDVVDTPKKKSVFHLSKDDGSLEYEEVKFFPKVTNQFRPQDVAAIFMQVFQPCGSGAVEPEFLIMGEDRVLRPVEARLLAEMWTAKTMVWSGLLALDLSAGTPGENILDVGFSPGEGEGVTSRQLMLTLLR